MMGNGGEGPSSLGEKIVMDNESPQENGLPLSQSEKGVFFDAIMQKIESGESIDLSRLTGFELEAFKTFRHDDHPELFQLVDLEEGAAYDLFKAASIEIGTRGPEIAFRLEKQEGNRHEMKITEYLDSLEEWVDSKDTVNPEDAKIIQTEINELGDEIGKLKHLYRRTQGVARRMGEDQPHFMKDWGKVITNADIQYKKLGRIAGEMHRDVRY